MSAANKREKDVVRKVEANKGENRIGTFWRFMLVAFALFAILFLLQYLIDSSAQREVGLFSWEKEANKNELSTKSLSKEEIKTLDCNNVYWTTIADRNAYFFLGRKAQEGGSASFSWKESIFVTYADQGPKEMFGEETQITFRDRDSNEVVKRVTLKERNIIPHLPTLGSRRGLESLAKTPNNSRFIFFVINWLGGVFVTGIGWGLSMLIAGSFLNPQAIEGFISSLTKFEDFGKFEDLSPASVPKTTFADVGGLELAKRDLREVVEFINEPQKFHDYGIKIPKGILLEGPPGNGKTLLAKALAGESKLPFIACSGSEFDLAFVGSGAARVRQLFSRARLYKRGVIVFIDEIDSVASKRSDLNRNNSAQTINQLLTEMDGFKERDRVFVLAATNDKKGLDPAILRPGRFDRHINIGNPTRKARREIIQLWKKRIKLLNFDFSEEELALMTAGFNASELVNLLNEAVVLVIRKGKTSVSNEEIFEAFDFFLVGKHGSIPPKTNKQLARTAYHEAGHALLYALLPDTFVFKVTVKGGGGINGYTWGGLWEVEEEEDVSNLDKRQILALITAKLGGRVAEEIIFGENKVSTGAQDDLERAAWELKEYILKFALSDLGVVPRTKDWFTKEIILPSDVPEKTKERVEEEREKIMNLCFQRARKILLDNRHLLKILAEELITYGELSREQVTYICATSLPISLRFLETTRKPKPAKEGKTELEKVKKTKRATTEKKTKN